LHLMAHSFLTKKLFIEDLQEERSLINGNL
jgi:hypothetical protein